MTLSSEKNSSPDAPLDTDFSIAASDGPIDSGTVEKGNVHLGGTPVPVAEEQGHGTESRSKAVFTSPELDKAKQASRRALKDCGITDHNCDCPKSSYMTFDGNGQKAHPTNGEQAVTPEQIRAFLVAAILDKGWTNVYFIRNGKIDDQLTTMARLELSKLKANPAFANYEMPQVVDSLSNVGVLHQQIGNDAPPGFSEKKFARLCRNEEKRGERDAEKAQREIHKQFKKCDIGTTPPPGFLTKNMARVAAMMPSQNSPVIGPDMPPPRDDNSHKNGGMGAFAQ